MKKEIRKGEAWRIGYQKGQEKMRIPMHPNFRRCPVCFEEEHFINGEWTCGEKHEK